METTPRRKSIMKWCKTLVAMMLLASGINALLLVPYVLAEYDLNLAKSFHRAVLLTVSCAIILLWQYRDRSAPLWSQPRQPWNWNWIKGASDWIKGASDFKLIILLVVSLIGVSGIALHYRQQALAVDQWTDVDQRPSWAK